MRLKLTVQGFKQLKDCTIELAPFTCLVGPNGAGKTTILQALEGYQSLTKPSRASNEDWVKSIGGWEQAAYNGTAPLIRFVIEAELRSHLYRHEIQLGPSGGSASVGPENFFIDGVSILDRHGFEYRYGSVIVGQLTAPASRLNSLPSNRPAQLSEYLAFVESWRFHHFLAEKTGQHISAGPVETIDRWGESLAGFIHTLATERPESLTRLVDAMREVIPGFQALSAPYVRVEGEQHVELRMRTDQTPLSVRGDHVAGGHMKALAILAALLQQPKVLALEEPDAGLHPRLLQWLVELLRSQSTDRFILVTTHHPWFVDNLHLDELRIVERTAEGTTIRAPQATGEARKHVEEALGTLVMNGLLK